MAVEYVRITGLDEFLATLSNMEVNIDVAGRTALLEVGALLERRLKERLSRPGTGRAYGINRGTKRIRYAIHIASAPGEPPAVLTGRLRASITHNVTGRPGIHLPNPGGGSGVVRAYVGTNVNHGYYLERGTRYIAPRPWFYVTIQAEMSNIVRIIKRVLTEHAERGKRRVR